MEILHHTLISPALGTQRTLTSLHYGNGGRGGPKAYIQAGLHADELPGMLVAHHLRGSLDAAEARGELLGQVVLVPMANPIGLNQTTMHHQIGRFELANMENFNRHYPDFFALVKDMVASSLTADPVNNARVIRHAMRDVLLSERPVTELQSLRRELMLLSHDADVVLDLHCDYEAVVHLYVEQALLDKMAPLAAYLGARALLWANGSGGAISFDEALSGPWWRLRDHFADRAPVPLACASTTVELRGQADVSPEFAKHDAQAILNYLQHCGILAGDPPALPAAACEATPLSATEAVHAPHSGVIVFAVKPGEEVHSGQLLAEIVDPSANRTTPVHASTDGVVYARHNLRWATTNLELCRVAGRTPMRSGNLLSP